MEKIERILQAAFDEKRQALTECEAYDVFDSLGLATPKRLIIAPVHIPCDEKQLAEKLRALAGTKAVVKVSSAKTLHKTESGGVKVCDKALVSEVLVEMKSRFPDADGFLVSEFAEHAVFALGQELMLGARFDQAFGPILTLGVGGTDAEALTGALRPGHSPAIAPVAMAETAKDWQEFLSSAWIWRYVSGHVRGGKRLAEDAEMLKWLQAFAGLVSRYRDGSDSPWTIEEVEANPLAVSRGRLVALDGVLRFRPSRQSGRNPPSQKAVWSLLKPATVAVAGVSEKKMNMGRIILNNVLEAGFPKDRLRILKDYAGEIDGVRCCARAADFPETIDMFVVAVPSTEVPAVLQEAASSGKVRGVVLISGGMGEKTGSEQVKDNVLAVIQEAKNKNPDFALSGGNSLGIVSGPAKVNTLFIPKSKLLPPIPENPVIARTAFISQSGAFVVATLSKHDWLRPAYSVTVGNQMDVTVCDYVERACEEEDLRVVLAYIEGLKEGDGLRLTRTIEKARKAGKIMVLYLAGRTPTGRKAVMGHTASIAGDFVVARSVFTKAGAIVAETFEEFEDFAQLACFLAGKPLGQGRMFLISNAGFETAGMADNILPGSAISAVTPDEALSARLQKILVESKLDSIVDVRNPLDATPMANDEALFRLAQAALASKIVDSAVISPVALTPAMKTLEAEGLQDSLAARLGELLKGANKPVVFCVASGTRYDAYVELARKQGVPAFRSADRAIRAFAGFNASLI